MKLKKMLEKSRNWCERRLFVPPTPVEQRRCHTAGEIPYPTRKKAYAVTTTVTALLRIESDLVALYLYVPGAVPAGTMNWTFPLASDNCPLNDAPGTGTKLALSPLLPVTEKVYDPVWPAETVNVSGLTLRK
jgi:hypothetical protein